MDGQFEEEGRRIMELILGETPEDDVLNLVRGYLDSMDNVSEAEVNVNHLQKVFKWLGMNGDVDWNDIMEGTHPDLEELVSVLNERPPLQEESLSKDDLMNTLPGRSDSCFTNTEMESGSANGQEEGTSELQAKSNKRSICSKTVHGTRRILDFSLDDDCNEIVTSSQEVMGTRSRTAGGKKSVMSKQEIVTSSQEAICTRSRTAGGKNSVMSKQDTDSSGDETQDPTESESPPQRKKVGQHDDETHDSAESESPPQRKKVDQNDDETQDSAESESPPQRKKVDQHDDETHDSAESESPPQRNKVDQNDDETQDSAGSGSSPQKRKKVDQHDNETRDSAESGRKKEERKKERNKVDDLCRDTRQILRKLTVANRKFKEIIKDPYNKYDSDDEVGSADRPSRTEKRRKFLAPQKNAKQVAWDGSDSDSSFDDNVIPIGIARKKKKTAKCAWSQDEMDYIRDGVGMFGAGDWAAIRDHYPFQIAHQNSVKIKDKYRNMVKNGLIVDEQ